MSHCEGGPLRASGGVCDCFPCSLFSFSHFFCATPPPPPPAFPWRLQILEINPRHPLVAGLLDKLAKDAEDSSKEVADVASVLYDVSLQNSGFSLEEPEAYSARMCVRSPWAAVLAVLPQLLLPPTLSHLSSPKTPAHKTNTPSPTHPPHTHALAALQSWQRVCWAPPRWSCCPR